MFVSVSQSVSPSVRQSVVSVRTREMDPMQQQQMQQQQQQPAVVSMPMSMPPRESYQHPMAAQYSQAPQQQHQQPPQQHQQLQPAQQPPQQQQPPQSPYGGAPGYGAQQPQQQTAPAMIMAPIPQLPSQQQTGQTVPAAVTPALPSSSAADGMASWYSHHQVSQIAAVTANAGQPGSNPAGMPNKPQPVEFTGDVKQIADIICPNMQVLLPYVANAIGSTSLANNVTALSEIYTHRDIMTEDMGFCFQKLFHLYQEIYPIYKESMLSGWLTFVLGMGVFHGNTSMLNFGPKPTIIEFGIDPIYTITHNTSTSTQGMSRAVAAMWKERDEARAARAAEAKARAEAAAKAKDATAEAGAEGDGAVVAAAVDADDDQATAQQPSYDDGAGDGPLAKRLKLEGLGANDESGSTVAPAGKKMQQKVHEAIVAIESDSSSSQAARDLAAVAKIILKTDVRFPHQNVYEEGLSRAVKNHPMMRRPEYDHFKLALNVGSVIQELAPALVAMNYMTLSKQSLKRYGPEGSSSMAGCSVKFSRPVIAPVSLMVSNNNNYGTVCMNNTGGLSHLIGEAMGLMGSQSIVLGTPQNAEMLNLVTAQSVTRAPGEKLKNESKTAVVLAIIKSASAYARTDRSIDLRAYAERTIFYNTDAIQARTEMSLPEKYRRDTLNLDIYDWQIKCAKEKLPVVDICGKFDDAAYNVRNYIELMQGDAYARFMVPLYEEDLAAAKKQLEQTKQELENEPMGNISGGKSGRRYDDSSAYKYPYGGKKVKH